MRHMLYGLCLIALMLAACDSGGDQGFIHVDESGTQTAIAITHAARANPSATPGPSPTPLPTLEPYRIPTLDPALDPDTVITRVGTEDITLAEYRKQVMFERWLRLYQLAEWIDVNGGPLDLRKSENALIAALLATLDDSARFGAEVQRVMIIDALSVQEARRRGIEVDPYQFNAILAQFLGLALGTGAQLPPEFDAAYADFLVSMTTYTGMTEEEFRRIVRARTLYEQLEFIIMNQPAADQLVRNASTGVEVHGLLLETEDLAHEVVARLNSGDSLTEIATALGFVRNEGQQNVVRASDDTLPGAIMTALFDASPGDIIGPFETSQGWYVAVVGDPVFDVLPPDEVTALKTRYFLDWVESRMDDPTTVRDFDDWRDHIPADPQPEDISPLLSDANVILPEE